MPIAPPMRTVKFNAMGSPKLEPCLAKLVSTSVAECDCDARDFAMIAAADSAPPDEAWFTAAAVLRLPVPVPLAVPCSQ